MHMPRCGAGGAGSSPGLSPACLHVFPPFPVSLLLRMKAAVAKKKKIISLGLSRQLPSYSSPKMYVCIAIGAYKCGDAEICFYT